MVLMKFEILYGLDLQVNLHSLLTDSQGKLITASVHDRSSEGVVTCIIYVPIMKGRFTVYQVAIILENN